MIDQNTYKKSMANRTSIPLQRDWYGEFDTVMLTHAEYAEYMAYLGTAGAARPHKLWGGDDLAVEIEMPPAFNPKTEYRDHVIDGVIGKR